MSLLIQALYYFIECEKQTEEEKIDEFAIQLQSESSNCQVV